MQTFLPYEDFAESAQALDDRRLGKQRVEAKQIIDIIRKKRQRHNEYIAQAIWRRVESVEEGTYDAWKKKHPIGWENHPAVLMWEPNTVDAWSDWWLARYGEAICDEWRRRGHRDTLRHFFRTVTTDPNYSIDKPPWWLGEERFHETHRARLYDKDRVHYEDFAYDRATTCCLTCNYWWPTHKRGGHDGAV